MNGMPMMMGMPMMAGPMMGSPMMGSPMMGGMMPAMMPMMCKMTMEMGKDGFVCKMMPMNPGHMDMMKDRVAAMTSMMSMGMPMMMMCGGMPMMMCTM
jgi:hypothetical protein